MRILYLTVGDHVDYQNDCLLIGLRELFGSDVVDYRKQEHNYLSYSEEKALRLYGKGMTVSRVLPDIDVDRTDIKSKIQNHYYDYVIYGSIWRCNAHIGEISRYYNSNEIIIIDGEDRTDIHKTFGLGYRYFKRELLYKHRRLIPISFGMPTSKIDIAKDGKTKDFAHLDPFNRKTYIYQNESDYYNGYKEARFGLTVKKGGWDCMRHYEIMANGCIPRFLNINSCPKLIMTDFPKKLCNIVNCRIESGESLKAIYDDMIESFEDHFLRHNTTLRIAKKFIDKIKEVQ